MADREQQLRELEDWGVSLDANGLRHASDEAVQSAHAWMKRLPAQGPGRTAFSAGGPTVDDRVREQLRETLAAMGNNVDDGSLAAMNVDQLQAVVNQLQGDPFDNWARHQFGAGHPLDCLPEQITEPFKAALAARGADTSGMRFSAAAGEPDRAFVAGVMASSRIKGCRKFVGGHLAVPAPTADRRPTRKFSAEPSPASGPGDQWICAVLDSTPAGREILKERGIVRRDPVAV